MLDDIDPVVARIAVDFYEEVASEAPKLDSLWYLADIFRLEDETIWIDDVGHITPEGNQLVAQEMMMAMEHEGLRGH